MKRFLLLLTILIPMLGFAQSNTLSIKFGIKYEDGNGYAYVFNTNGTGIWSFTEEDYTGEETTCTMKFTWKKKTNTILSVTRDVYGEKKTYDVKIIDSKTIKINTYSDKWETFKLGK